MTSASKTLDVSIMGREYRVACPPDQEKELLEAVVYLDRKMREIRDSGKVVGLDRIAVMAALNLANELLKTRGRGETVAGDLGVRLRRLNDRVEAALARGTQLEM